VSTRDEKGKFAHIFSPTAEAEADILRRRKAGETLAVIAAEYGTSKATIQRFVKKAEQRKATEAKQRRAARAQDVAAQPERARTQPAEQPDTPDMQELTSVVRKRDGSASITLHGSGPLRVPDRGGLPSADEEMSERGYVPIATRVSLFRNSGGGW